jgi:hypothetical protein
MTRREEELLMLRPSARSEPAVVEIGGAAAAALVDAARSLPVSGWDFPAWPNVSLRGTPPSSELAAVVREIGTRLDGNGFCVARLPEIIAEQPEGIAAGAATLLATAFGSPFRIYQNNPGHWRSLGADPKRPANRSEGIGLQLPHTDFCNAEFPPDIVCLLCLRPDPLGGGASLVARIDGIEDMLPPAEVEALSRPVFRDGQVVDLSGVGEDANPFAIISMTPGERFRYRFVGHLLDSAPEPGPRAAVRALVDALWERMVTIPLTAGDLLLVNQHRAVHGRAALGTDQDNVPEAAKRRLLLSFLRTGPEARPH